MAKRKNTKSTWISEDVRSGKFWIFALIIFALPITLLMAQQQQSMQQDAAYTVPMPTKGPAISSNPTIKPSMGNKTPTPHRTSPIPTRRPQISPIPTARPSISIKQPTSTVAGQISGIMYVDKNKNGKRDTGEVGFAGVAVTVQNLNYQTVCKTNTSNTGSYVCKIASGNGTYRVTLSYPLGYQVVSSNPVTVSISANKKSANAIFRLIK